VIPFGLRSPDPERRRKAAEDYARWSRRQDRMALVITALANAGWVVLFAGVIAEGFAR